MLWIYCGLFLFSVVGESGTASAAAAFASKREADYTLDDSFWNEESPVGEVERLLREYRQNQELVRNIGAHYYQIIYPVQLRHHEKMGISTREIGAPKVRKARSTFPQRGGYGGGSGSGGDGGNYQGTTRGRTRTGKHFHRTSLLIKAFNHKFRLDLELNTQLLAPNLMQKHFLLSGAEQISKQEIEHCYYHGTVKDYPGASAAFHTCNGVSGVIHVGNETFVIHPFYGGDLSKHPHVIFEARTKANKGCANSGNLEWKMKNFRRQKHLSGLSDTDATPRTKRDVREATKYIETAIVIDKAMFDKRNGSTRAEVVHDAIQVANIADLYFRTLNTRVSVVYIETWQGGNQAPISKNEDISRSLLNFNDYTSRNMFKVDKDTTQLLTGETFQGGEAGMAVPETVCTSKSVGISVDINTYEPHLLAGTMAHMIGHNIGMGHDDGREECFCRDWHGCIMAQSIVGLENVQPYKFSECSRSDYIDALRIGHGICLLNKPNELVMRRTCGNGIVEEGEDCDCGTIDECHDKDSCCDPITCKLKKESQCASGPCCENCMLMERGVVCRRGENECDLPELCTGEHGNCPIDVYKKNGTPCGQKKEGYCFNGVCPTLDIQCGYIWGQGGIAADPKCFEQFNSKGSINGHCGLGTTPGQFMKCTSENVQCGSLQCQNGSPHPEIDGLDGTYSRTIISIRSIEYECKATSGSNENPEIPLLGLVRDGTPCGKNLICVNQTCASLFQYMDQGKCPSNHNEKECSEHGFCTNMNRCHCEPGWTGSDCSIETEIIIPLSTAPTKNQAPSEPKHNTSIVYTSNVTPYEANNTDNLSTLSMVFIMVGVVKGVFICFALMAVCYRKSTVPKYEPPYVKKPISKKYSGPASNHSQEDSMDNANKILAFGSVPSFSRADSQRVLYRPSNHMSAAAAASHFQEHKMQQLKRMGGLGSGSEEDPTHSGEEESVSFIDLQHNNLSKLPEKKGILKKHPGYGLVMVDGKDKWGSQSDNLEIMSQSDNNIGEMMTPGTGGGGGGSTMSEVERTLKSLNGYHEDILEALRTAASHRGAAATPSGSNSLLSEEILRKTLQDCSSAVGYNDYGKRASSQEKICEMPQTHTVMVEGSPSRLHIHPHQQPPDEDEDDEVPPCGPIRIRNLEDLIRQLEHHSRHMSPSGSEDIRMSETEADRHYRLESSSVCSESSQSQSRCRGRGDDETRFVYGRYRQPPGSRHPYPHPHHHSHHHGMAEEESIYETADHDRGADQCGDTPDSESDEFIQAQQQLVRWASEEAVSKAGPSSSGGGGSNGVCVAAAGQREYFPSPVTSESEESGGEGNSIARAPPSHHHHHHTRTSDVSPMAGPSAATVAEQTALLSSRPKRYPEYKH